MCTENLKCVALAVPEIRAFWLGDVNLNLGEQEVVEGHGWYH